MRGAKVTEKLALATSVVALSLSCASNHRVSPWGAEGRPSLFAYAPPPDLAAQLRAVDREAAALGLRLEVELRGKLPRGAGELVVRGYTGADALGRRATAVRVATPRGVVMAVGPLAAADADRSRATELVPSLIPGAVATTATATEAGTATETETGTKTRAATEAAVFSSGTDLNGDGTPDVALRSEAGVLEIWAVRAAGAAPYPVQLEAPPTLALDVDGDGRVELGGRVAIPEGDPIAPDLLDVATFEGDGYTDRSATARVFHAEEAAARRPTPAPAAGAATAPAAPPASPAGDARRLRRAIERAWHARLAGEPREAVLAELDRERVPEALRAAFAAHRARVAITGARTASGTPGGR